jgi:hypothetical protein
MREVVKEPLDVGIENELESFTVEPESLFQGLMAVTSRAEAVGRVMKQGFKDRRQQAANHLLSHTVFDGWNAEGANLRFIFGNEDAPQRVRLKRTLLQLPQQSLEILFKVGFKPLDTDLVDSRGATIALDGFENPLVMRPVREWALILRCFTMRILSCLEDRMPPNRWTILGCFLAKGWRPERGSGGPGCGFSQPS